MIFLKLLILASIFGTISAIGIKMASSYKVRASNLKQIKKALKILEAKITYTYDKLPDLFLEIANKIGGDVGNLFFDIGRNMELEFAGEAWENALKNLTYH